MSLCASLSQLGKSKPAGNRWGIMRKVKKRASENESGREASPSPGEAPQLSRAEWGPLLPLVPVCMGQLMAQKLSTSVLKIRFFFLIDVPFESNFPKL